MLGPTNFHFETNISFEVFIYPAFTLFTKETLFNNDSIFFSKIRSESTEWPKKYELLLILRSYKETVSLKAVSRLRGPGL